MLLRHIARAVIHQQAAIRAHRKRMRYPHHRNLANNSSGRSTSIVTALVTSRPRRKKRAYPPPSTPRPSSQRPPPSSHPPPPQRPHHRHVDARRAGVAVTRSSCEPHARPSHACCFGLRWLRFHLSVRLQRPGRFDPAGFSYPFGLSPCMATAASRAPCVTSSTKALNPHHSCSSCMSARAPPAHSTHHAARSTPNMLLLAGERNHAARLVLLVA